MTKTSLVVKIIWAAVALGIVAAFVVTSVGVAQRENAKNVEAQKQAEALRKRQNALVQACAEEGLEAIDIDPPHTPKCLNLQTGIMTVPKTVYVIRGGHM